jgi:hypothetical protein
MELILKFCKSLVYTPAGYKDTLPFEPVFTGSLLHTGHTNNEHYFMGCGGGGGT